MGEKQKWKYFYFHFSPANRWVGKKIHFIFWPINPKNRYWSLFFNIFTGNFFVSSLSLMHTHTQARTCAYERKRSDKVFRWNKNWKTVHYLCVCVCMCVSENENGKNEIRLSIWGRKTNPADGQIGNQILLSILSVKKKIQLKVGTLTHTSFYLASVGWEKTK